VALDDKGIKDRSHSSWQRPGWTPQERGEDGHRGDDWYRRCRVSGVCWWPPSLTAEEVEASREGIRRSAGAWNGLVDADRFKEYVRNRRRASNRPDVSL